MITRSRLGVSSAEVKQAYLRLIQLLTYVSFPLMLGLAATAHPFVLAVLGGGWAAMIPLVSILAIGRGRGSTDEPGRSYSSQGRPKPFRIGLLSERPCYASDLVRSLLGGCC